LRERASQLRQNAKPALSFCPERAQSKLPQNQAFVRTRSRCKHPEFLLFGCEISGWRKNCPSRLEGIQKRISRVYALSDILLLVLDSAL
jgi:hypothetical protein